MRPRLGTDRPTMHIRRQTTTDSATLLWRQLRRCLLKPRGMATVVPAGYNCLVTPRRNGKTHSALPQRQPFN